MKLREKILGILALLGVGTAGTLGALNYRENIPLHHVYNASATTTAGSAMEVSSKSKYGCEVITQAVTGTLKFPVSLSDAQPSWDVAQSVTNTWDYAQIVDLQDGTSYDGDVGLVFTGSTDVRNFEINVDVVKWINADMTSYTSGTTTVACKPANNQ